MSDNAIEILLVEDNPNDVKLAIHAFQKHHLANAIHVARDGEEAFDFLFSPSAEASQPKLVLLDLKLPKVDGLEVLKRIKVDPRTRTIPVVVMTSSQEESDLVEGYHLGANSYLVKPIDFEQFIEVIRHIGYYWLLLNRPIPVA